MRFTDRGGVAVAAADETDPAPQVQCVPPSGTAFPLGDTAVNCSAVDFCGNRAQCSFTVSVQAVPDTTPPTLVCPSNIIRAVYPHQVPVPVTFVAPATDEVDPAPTVVCQPPSGAAFALGETVVTCNAQDFSTNLARCSFVVRLVVSEDYTPPELHCADLQVNTLGWSAVVTFSPTVTDDMDPAPQLTCVPPSGSVFPLGQTLVTCAAQDRGGQTSTCGFVVTVGIESGWGCGSVFFGNPGAAMTNPITGQLIPAGDLFRAALYFLPDRPEPPSDADFDYGAVLGPAVGFLAPGLFNGGTRYAPVMPCGGFGWFQVRVWESVFGTNVFSTFEQAAAARQPVDGRLPVLLKFAPVRQRTGDATTLPPGTPSTLGFGAFQDTSGVTVRLCLTPPAGLVAWWPGDGTGHNLAGSGSADLHNVIFGPGQVGQAFRLLGLGSGAVLPDAPRLPLEQFTVELWVQRASADRGTRDAATTAALWAAPVGGFRLVVNADGRLGVERAETGPMWSDFRITDTQFHHVAVTKGNGQLMVYLDGTGQLLTATAPELRLTPPLILGAADTDLSRSFWGTIDEVTLYNRALSEDEIRSLAAGTAGKCLVPLPPVLLAQPGGQTTCPGYPVGLAVAAAGTAPLRYQWWFEGSPVEGGTDPILSWSSLEPNQAGAYQVVVGNAAGAVTSAVAVLSLDTRPPQLTLAGGSALSVECGQDFSDPGASAQDACHTASAVAVEGVVDPNRPGVYALAYQATDLGGQTSSAFRQVTVVDTTPPQVDCPPDGTVVFADASGAPVSYALPAATDLCTGPVPVHCYPPPGSRFPIGSSVVVCRAADPQGNTVQCSFSVHVLGARGAIEAVRGEVTELESTLDRAKEQAQWRQACRALDRALSPGLWPDETHLNPRHGVEVFDALHQAVQHLAQLGQDRRNGVPKLMLERLQARLVQAARLLAVVELEDAAARGVAPKVLVRHWAELERGDAEAAHQAWAKALSRYRQAWMHSVHLLVQWSRRGTQVTVWLQARGWPSDRCVVEASSNLVDWVSVGWATVGPDGVVRFSETVSASGTRFYRLKRVDPP